MKTTHLFLLVLCALVVPVFAQEQATPPSAARGQALAQRWCAPCHLVRLRLSAIDPPTFYAITHDPSKTPDYIRNFLVSPHKDMPPIQLTPSQIEDLIAYFEAMKKQ
jgi:mono/diheme cytochrome c family protein